MDVSGLFAIHVSPLELMLRGTLMYWFLLLIFRFVLRRDPGSFGVADILMVVVIADASQNAMSGSYDTVGEGWILVATLVFWNYALDWASYRWPLAHKLTEPPPLQLIKAGRVLGRNLRKEFLTREDLEAQLRQAGVEDVAAVRAAYLEGDGKLSVLRYDDKPPARQDKDEGPPGA
ncbi:hypothetical protein ASC95_03095 [Pelomonas sp. Root1217]|jgi:uncharacterized membrane protein YcaP (DUF421 family)|uniref:DUF421 domain-containing protein n=1 Tax=Pelomonas sp. Root1217 TaxID=1736430 RepID=UPI00070C753D|nr:YetF domain-containing protein [Pelomonas sp. Root1217]KQV60454.1 hypothetical protein ASC95_03095 [Pelomonas sp. Root1217]